MQRATKLIIAAGIVLIVLIIRGFYRESKDTKMQTPKQIALEQAKREEKIRHNKIDYALSQFKDMIKGQMNDPNSFEMVKRAYDKEDTGDTGDTVKLMIVFRGKNALGSMVKQTAWGEYYLDNETIQLKHLE